MNVFPKKDQMFMNIKKQLTICGIYIYHEIFLFIAIFIHKNSYHLFVIILHIVNIVVSKSFSRM